jgi:hypothetical protein
MTQNLKSLAENAPLIYDSDYFTGCQVSIYVGDVWVDEIAHFQLELSQMKTPIYGYASELWDTIALGPKLVRGAFAINFKEAGYLFAVLLNYRNKVKFGKSTDPYVEKNVIMRANIERMMSLPEGDARLLQAYYDIASFASEAQKTKKGLDKFESFAELYEDAVWDATSKGKFETRTGMKSRSSFVSELNGFDIYIQFGDFTNEYANHTTLKVENVQLVGKSITIAADDEPLMEGYSFIARDLI